jgi:type II secretory pathway pseudopilin PulG
LRKSIAHRRRLAEEKGFTIVEASIAMLIVAMMFTALSAGLISGLRATRDARLFQQATAIGEEAVEAARDLNYDTLVMQTSDLAGDPRVQSGPRFDPDQSGPLVSEPIVTSTSGGAIVPHITTEVVFNTTFRTSRYVTWVDDALQGGPAQSYKRMVVMIEWDVAGRTNSYVTSSFIALARRGLPVPKFELSPQTQTVQVEQGNLVAFPHTIRNLGIVDTYDLEMTTNPRNWVVNFYKDNGQIGTFEPVVDSLLLDSNSTGTPDTGSVNTNESTHVLAVFLLGLTEAVGTVNMTLTATSGANNSVTRTATDTVVIGFASLILNLHNKPSPPVGDTTAQKPMSMNLSPVSASTLYKYSTDYDNTSPGRFVDIKTPNPTHSETSTRYMANWVHQIPQNTLFNGTAEVKIWVARKDLSCTGGPVQMRAFLRTKITDTTDAGVQLATGDGTMVPTGIGTCPLQQITISMNMTNVNVPINTWLELKITTRNTTGDAALIAYDTTTYPSTLKLPRVST